jgi:hypothetical protein
MAESIVRLFLLVNGYFTWILYIEKHGMVMRSGKEDGPAAALLSKQLIFWSSHPEDRESLRERRQHPCLDRGQRLCLGGDPQEAPRVATDPHTTLQVLSVTLFERMLLIQALTITSDSTAEDERCNQW